MKGKNRQKKKEKLPQNGEALQSNSTVRKLQLLLKSQTYGFSNSEMMRVRFNSSGIGSQ